MNAPPSDVGLRRPASLLRACALLTIILLAALPCFAAYGYWTSGNLGIVAALVACGLCLVAGTLALVVTGVAQKMNQGVQGVFGAMLVRMSIPLVAIFMLPRIGGPLPAAGITGMLMAYYLITLAVETWLSLRFVPAAKNSAPKNSGAGPAAKVV